MGCCPMTPPDRAAEKAFKAWFDQEYPQLDQIIGKPEADSMKKASRNSYSAGLAAGRQEPVV